MDIIWEGWVVDIILEGMDWEGWVVGVIWGSVIWEGWLGLKKNGREKGGVSSVKE